MRTSSLLAGLVFAGVATAASADTGSKQEQAACRPDVRKLCSNIGKADEQQYRACLQFHFGELSPKCQQILTAHPS
jgi:hypothetical protein